MKIFLLKYNITKARFTTFDKHRQIDKQNTYDQSTFKTFLTNTNESIFKSDEFENLNSTTKKNGTEWERSIGGLEAEGVEQMCVYRDVHTRPATSQDMLDCHPLALGPAVEKTIVFHQIKGGNT